ncbi:UbiA family prenyltransferase [Halobaculum sp. MBLA0143]|uniref:UbiA family prenyltransferase n=1 Tax=Halobaculum sp. MBLA0143 TaxID=3079933 RepID=UPI003523910B
MTVARDAAGPAAALRAFASQVHPVFMLPPLAGSVFGAVLAAGTVPDLGGSFEPVAAAVHVAAMFFAVYTAHVKDGYVDFYRREEDDDHPLSEWGCRAGLVGAAVGFFAALAGVTLLGGPVAAALALPTWVVGYLHAPQLDTNPVTATGGYPVGIALCILGGYAVQTGGLAAAPVAFAGVFLAVLTGVKVIDDATDYEYDRSIDKRTVAVVLGRERSRRLAYGLMGLGLFAVVAFTVDGLFPPASPAGGLAFAVVAVLAADRDPKTATMLLVRGAYLLLAGLVVAVFFRPLAGVPLPDVTVLGPYTYLATEVVFGSAAFALLTRAGAVRRALTTVAALYPVAYLWDWYTLTVGVFAIPMRTGVELLGIPLEEHLFMLVVPAFVLGIHETIYGDGRPERATDDERERGPEPEPDASVTETLD